MQPCQLVHALRSVVAQQQQSRRQQGPPDYSACLAACGCGGSWRSALIQHSMRSASSAGLPAAATTAGGCANAERTADALGDYTVHRLPGNARVYRFAGDQPVYDPQPHPRHRCMHCTAAAGGGWEGVCVWGGPDGSAHSHAAAIVTRPPGCSGRLPNCIRRCGGGADP